MGLDASAVRHAIDIGVDQSSQAPSLSSVNTQIIANITDSSASGT